jgi:hypothetical protein
VRNVAVPSAPGYFCRLQITQAGNLRATIAKIHRRLLLQIPGTWATHYKEEFRKRTIGAERRRSVTLSEPCQESRGIPQLSPGTLLFTQVLRMFCMLCFVDK